MTIDGVGYYEKDKAGAALIERCKTMTSTDPTIIGEYRGFKMILSFDSLYKMHRLTLQNSRSYTLEIGTVCSVIFNVSTTHLQAFQN